MSEYGDLMDAEEGRVKGDNAAVTKNSYGALMDEDAATAQKQQVLRGSLTQARDANPDAAGKARQISRATGLPTDVVERNLPEVERDVALHGADELVTRAPVTAQHLSDPDFARVAKDDVANLQGIEHTVNPPPAKPIVNSAMFSEEVNKIYKDNPVMTWDDARHIASERFTVNDTDHLVGVGNPGGPKADLGTVVEGLWQSFKTGGESVRQGLRAQFADALGLQDMKDDAIAQYAKTQLTDVVTKPHFDSRMSDLAYGGASNVMQNAPILAAAILTRDPTIAAALAAVQTEAQAYPKYRARGATGGEAALGSAIEGVIEFATEKIPLKFLTDSFGKIPTWQLFVGDQAREQITEQIATHTQDLTDALIANPNMTIKQYLDARPDAALQTAVAVIMQGVAVGTAHKASVAMAGKSEAALKADKDALMLSQMFQLSQASKVLQRDPQSFETFATAAAEAGQVGDVYVDARTFAQSAGDSLQQIVKTSPAVAAQLDEAMKSGGDLVIPTGEYATRIAALDTGNKLLPHLRMGPEAFSQEEAKTFMQSQAETFNKETEKVLEERHFDQAFKESAANVEKELFTQLKTANRFTDDVNGAYAKLMASFYTVQAARLGITPEQMYVKYPLQVRAEALAGKRSLNQAPDEQDIVSPIDRGAPPAVKVQQLRALSEQNVQPINDFLAGIDAQFGTQSKPSFKDAEKILAKAERPSIRATKPWFDVEHVRDSYRFKTVLQDMRQLPEIIAQLPKLGATVIKADVAKVLKPKEWGWRIASFDLRMPNGQIVEYYLPIAEQEAIKKAVNHDLFEKWREEEFPITDPVKKLAYERDVEKSYSNYEAAWEASLARTGADERAILAALTSSAASAGGSLSKSSLSSSGENAAALTQTPLTNEAPNGSSNTIILERDALAEANIGKTSDDSIAKNAAFGQGERGQISFGDKGATLALLQHADLSTWFHESGHFYLEVLSDLASQPDAPAEIVADMAKILKWFGVPDLATWRSMPIDEQREHHEKFARGFEAYLFEGKTPNQELNGLFSRFRAWLINVYKHLSALNVDLTDEVRGVMDRLIATNDQIIAAESARGYAPLFKSIEESGMTTAEWQAYQDLALEATQDAVDDLQKRSLRDMQWLTGARDRMLKKLQKDAAAKRADVEAEVTKEVRAQPVYAAQRFMRYGELPEANYTNAQRKLLEEASLQGTKLNLPDLKEMYGEGPAAQWRYLPTGKTGLAVSKDGLHPDVVAELFGFKSGDELVQKVLDAQPESTVIEGMTDQRSLERYGDLSNPDTIKKAAAEAIHNEARARFIHTELRALDKATNPREDTGRLNSKGHRITIAVLPKAARQFAESIIARKKIKEVRPVQYEAAEARAARAAETKTDLVEKATEKRNQLVNHYATKAAYEALDDFDKGIRYFRKFDAEGTRKNIDIEYREQIDALLDRFDIRKAPTQREAAKRKSLAEWITSQEELGLQPAIDPELVNEARRTPVRELTVEEFRGLVDAVRNIEHLGRLKKKLLTIKDQREFEAIVGELSDSINTNSKKDIPERRVSDRGLLVDTGKLMRNFLADHRKFASLAREMDGWADGGKAWDYLVHNMNDAGNFEAVEREKATMHLTKLLGPVLKAGKMGVKQYFASSGKSFTREERIGMALNMGNEINRERVMTGERLSPIQLHDILDTLTEQDWKFVQQVWDYFESFRPQMAAKQRRLTGVEPTWVEPTSVHTRFGDLRGGYFPIKYDPIRSERSNADIQAEVQRQIERGLFVRAQTRRGHLEARAESTGRPLRYDLATIVEHVDQVIHDLAWHEYLIDANRLMRAGAVESAIRDHYGVEKLRTMKATLKDIAVGDIGAQSAADSLINYFRHGATIAGLGWRLTTSLLQPIGLTQSISRIGSKWVLKGAVHWATNPVDGVNVMNAKSDFMRLRAKTMQREINEIRNQVKGEDSRIEASYFYLIQKMQLVADTPTWWGGYEKAMAMPNMTEDKAIGLADQAVIDSQGAGQIKDLAAVQRGSPAWKLFTNFYSFFNTTYNNTAEVVGRTNLKSPTSVAMMAVDLALLYTIPAMLGTAMKVLLHGDWDDEEKVVRQLIADQLTFMLGTVVLVREIGSAVQGVLGLHGGDYQGPAGVRFLVDFAKLAKQIGQGEADEAFWKALNESAGVLFHYPAGQINATASGIAAMVSGRTENPGALIVGASAKK